MTVKQRAGLGALLAATIFGAYTLGCAYRDDPKIPATFSLTNLITPPPNLYSPLIPVATRPPATRKPAPFNQTPIPTKRKTGFVLGS